MHTQSEKGTVKKLMNLVKGTGGEMNGKKLNGGKKCTGGSAGSDENEYTMRNEQSHTDVQKRNGGGQIQKKGSGMVFPGVFKTLYNTK